MLTSCRDAVGCLATELLVAEDAGTLAPVVAAATTAVNYYAGSETMTSTEVIADTRRSIYNDANIYIIRF